LTVRVLKCIAIAQSMTARSNDFREPNFDSRLTAKLPSFCMLEDRWVEVRCVVVRFFWWLLPMPETGGNLKEKRQLWHFKKDAKSDGI